MPADLIIYALIAAGLVLWLRSVLGTKHGEERDRPNPFLMPAEGETADTGMPAAPRPEEKIAALAATPKGSLRIGNKTAEMGLTEIAHADRNFDVEAFLTAAGDAFAIIIEAFARGERSTLRDLLEDNVYRAFEQAITERERSQQVMSAEIQSIRKAEITEARLERGIARITVDFEALELTFVRDSSGNLLYGHPEKPGTMRDIWVFSRDTKSRDPRWLLSETRGHFDDDNAAIPNA